MSVIIILITASLVIAGGFLVAFIWSVKAGQYEDDYTPSVRMLFENTVAQKTSKNSQSETKNLKSETVIHKK
jgi:cbb3-type cytochrome oxidase maturation protein